MLHERLADVVGPRYALERELPGGGMARVFLARDPRLERRVVIKVLPPERATAVGMERFQREARLLARLNHPHIIPILDSGHDHALPWFAMPWIEGQTLAERLTTGSLPESEVRGLALELLDALSHAHRLGVVHRDIKPANVFLHAGHALLADFGVAAIIDATGAALTDEGMVLGTLGYMAPEHRASGRSDTRSDIWELAATLYEACTGIRWTSAAPTGAPWHEVPIELAPALQRALAVLPKDRWPDAESFAAALRRRPATISRSMLFAAGLGAAALMVGWGQFVDRGPALSSSAPTALVHFIPEPGSPSWVLDVARNATTTLEWLPSTRAAAGVSLHRAPIEIRMRVAGSADSALLLEGTDATGRLALRERVLGAADDWSRAVADVVVQRLFPAGLADFRLLANSTENVSALQAWYQGSAAFQSARWDDAERFYREALRQDPDFLAASWSLLLTEMWRREPHHEALQELVARSADLPPIIRSLVEAQVEPHLPTRMALFDSVAASDPDFAPARMLRANELFHRGPLIGRSLQEGVDAFIEAARDIPELDHRTTWQHVLWGAIRLGDETTARAAWQRLARWPGDLELTTFLGMGLDARFSTHGATARRGLLQIFATGDRLGSMSRYLRLGLDFDIPREVQRMADVVASRSTDPEQVAGALAARATTLLMQGRVAEALHAMDDAVSVAVDPLPYQLQAAEWRILLPTIGLVVDSSQRMQARALLVTLAGHQRYWPRAAWALAISETSTSSVAWGDSLARGALNDSLANHLLPLWRAHQLAAAADPAAALAASDSIFRDPGDAMVIERGALARPLTYLARGYWQLQLGDSAAAQREWRWHENNDLQGWPMGPPQDGELDAALSAPARLLRAALLCRGGASREGLRLLDRAVALWSRADRALGSDWSIRRDAEHACR